jgi:2-polyprenyl-6-methoxyphenol hydroxylase-like FAD-dependent oxidoreductase
VVEIERILIVGGGIAGLTLATALHQYGLTAELVERSPAWHAAGAGIAVQPNGMSILGALGMGGAIEQAGAVICQWGYCSQQGEVLCETDLRALWGNTAPFIGIERTSLHQVLRAAAAAVPARLGVSPTSLTQEDGTVSVRFTDGSAADYDLVVGADGIDSTVRTLAFGTTPPVYAGQMSLRSVAPIRPCGLTGIRMLLGDGCYFGLCPLGDGRTYAFANMLETRFHDPLPGRLGRLRERFSAFGRIVQEYLAALASDAQIHAAPIESVEQERWHVGRVVLIGDAAHATAPMMAQGGCMAMEDAYVLADALCSAESVEAALDTYIDRRTPRVQWVQEQSRAVAESFRVPIAIRDATLRARGDQLFQDRFHPLVAPP